MVSVSERDLELIQPSLNHYQGICYRNKAMSDSSYNYQHRPDLMYVYVGNFSQSTTCIITRRGECSSTLLHKLWYTYSYIYKPTTTICYGIYVFLNSQHTGTFWLLPCVEHTTTTSASIPLFTTSSFTTRCILQSLVLLESASSPPFSITLSTFLVNFIKATIFLFLACVVNENNGPNSHFYFTVAAPHHFDIIQYYVHYKPTTPS